MHAVYKGALREPMYADIDSIYTVQSVFFILSSVEITFKV